MIGATGGPKQMTVAEVVQKIQASGQTVTKEVMAGLEPHVTKINSAIAAMQGESSFTPAKSSGNVGVDLGNGLASMMQGMAPFFEAAAGMQAFLGQHGIDMPNK